MPPSASTGAASNETSVIDFEFHETASESFNLPAPARKAPHGKKTNQFIWESSSIVDPNTVPTFPPGFKIPPMSGQSGGFTLEQRHIVKTLYQPKWTALEEREPTRVEESAWKTKALAEILGLDAFKGLYSQPPAHRTSTAWDEVSLLVVFDSESLTSIW